MSNKMACPVCGAGKVLEFPDGTFACDSEYCPSYDETDSNTYNLLIEIHKEFEIMRKALEWLGNNHLAENPVRVEQLRQHARKALAQIEHKE